MKNYKEIAKNVFKKRDEYLAKRKKKKRLLIATAMPGICCFVVLLIGLGLWKNGALSTNISIDTFQTDSEPSDINLSANSPQKKTTSPQNSSHNSSSSKPTNSTTIGSQSGSTTSQSTETVPTQSSQATTTQPSQSTTTRSTQPTSSQPSDPSSSQAPQTTFPNPSISTPPLTEDDYFIDSIDKMNFYSAKKIINENSFFPISANVKGFSKPNVMRLNQSYVKYPIDRDKIFTITMVTYFTIELHDEQGFLAQKLGGTGLVEVVVTQNDIDDLGYMITFKREENYYSCFTNGGSADCDYGTTSRRFSSHKYIDGFDFVKNFEQENYQFIVHYEGAKVIGFECQPFKSVPTKYAVDDVTFFDDFCIVLFTNQNFTIDQLELFFKNENNGEWLYQVL